MTSLQPLLSPLTPPAYTALRVVTGALFMQHGVQKMFGLLGGRQVDMISQFGLAGIIELVGGLLIAVGLFTTPVAFLASGEMAFAYLLSHAPRGPWPIQNNGEVTILYCFLFLYISTRGGGRSSLDALRR